MKNLFLFCVIIILSSCISIKDFTNDDDLLLVGQLVCIREKNVPNGIFKNNIKLTIKNIDSGVEKIANTNPDGFFFFRNLDEGNYELVEINYEREIGNMTYHLYNYIDRYFTVSKGKVNNLGLITISTSEKKVNISFDNHESVQSYFNTNYYNLQWNSIEWITTGVTTRPQNFIIEEVSNEDKKNWNIASLDTARNVDYLTVFEKNVILELNKVRSNPKKYGELYIKPILENIDGDSYSEPGKEEMIITEGIVVIRELYYVLSNMKNLPLLYPKPDLSLAAKEHVMDQGATGITGHFGSDNSSPSDRIKRQGSRTGNFFNTELILYGTNRADIIIMNILIDDNHPSRENRKNILDPDFDQIGVSVGVHKRYGTMCVINLAQGKKGNKSVVMAKR